MNKRLFLSLSLLTAALSLHAEESEYFVYPSISAAQAKIAAGVSTAGQTIASGYGKMRDTLNQAEEVLPVCAHQAGTFLKSNIWDRSFTFRGVEYTHAGKYATAGTAAIAATALAYKLGLYGKTKTMISKAVCSVASKMKSGYTAVKGFRPFAKKAKQVEAKSTVVSTPVVEAKQLETTVEPKSTVEVQLTAEPKQVETTKPVVQAKRAQSPQEAQSAARGSARYKAYIAAKRK